MNKTVLPAAVVVLMFSGCMGQSDLTKTFGDAGIMQFSALGFDPSADMGQLAAKAAAEGAESDTPFVQGGKYNKLALADGIELWAFTKDGAVLGLRPFFRGSKGNRAKIMRNITDPSHSYSGGFEGWPVLSEPDGTTKEAYPFVFECPSYNIHSKTQFPRTVNLYVTVYATGVKLYPDEKTYIQTESGNPPRSFALASSFPSDGVGSPKAATVSSFTGVVRDTKVLKNALTGKEFRWMSIETYGMTVDVVADEKLLQKTPEIGNVAAVSGWFSGDWG